MKKKMNKAQNHALLMLLSLTLLTTQAEASRMSDAEMKALRYSRMAEAKKSEAKKSEDLFEKLSFRTERMVVRPLRPEELHYAKAVDDSDQRHVNIMDDAERDFPAQVTALKCTDTKQLLAYSEFNHLYYGAFSIDAKELFGLIKVNGWNSSKSFLHFDIKFHRNHQGKGYATEATKGLFAHYQTLSLIPITLADENSASSCYLGFSAFIEFTNKASLKCNIINAGYRVGSLVGDDVLAYYPSVIRVTRQTMPNDPSLHDRIETNLKQYLSRDDAESKKAELDLRRVSLTNLLSVSPSLLNDQLEQHAFFIGITLDSSPELLSLIPTNLQGVIEQLLAAQVKAIFSQHYPTSVEQQRANDFISKLNGARALLKKYVPQTYH